MSGFHLLRVANCTRETRDAVVISFELSEQQREAFRFVQGQHLTLRANFNGEEVRRSYSICSAPFEDQIRIAVKRVQDGVFSTWANEHLRAGHLVECMEPSGSFGLPLDSQSARHSLAIVAGSGITPVLSILKTTLATEPESRFTLVYGNRSSSSVLFKEDLADLKDEYLARFNLIYVLSREQQEIDLFHGRIDRARCDELLRRWINPSDIDVAYLCGPQSMMEEVSASLQSAGIAKDSIRMELFASGKIVPLRTRTIASTPDAARCKVTVIQDGHTRNFLIASEKHTLLDAALEQGIELPYSCKGGVCSTCRCKMIVGQVDMDSSLALEDYEVARGFILPCQSYPLTSEIVLDYDQEN